MTDTPKNRAELKRFLWDYGDQDLLETLEAAGLAVVPVETLKEIHNYINVQADNAQVRRLQQSKLYDDNYWQPVADRTRFDLWQLIAASPFVEKADD